MEYAKLYAGVWDKINRSKARTDPRYGIWDGDDFNVVPNTVASTGNYVLTTDAGGSEALSASSIGGVYVVTTDGDDNDETTLTRAPVAGNVKITVDSGSPVAFEARVKIVEVADLAVFIGLTEEGLGADLMTDDDGIMADKDHVGFHILTATPTEIDAIYRKDGQTAVEVDGDTYTSDAGWHRYGFNFDGADVLKYYVDGDEVCSATINTTTFPSGEELGFTIGIKTGEAVVKTYHIDWWDVAQKIDRAKDD